MIQSTRTFRVFVSSTFSDLKAERNALQEKVFPRLKELCTQHGCRFQAIDLRWGVSEEAALDQQAMKICLGEVARCQELSPRPNFIVLLGDRYGWQPGPYEIPAVEYDAIIRHVRREEKDLLSTWYRRDDNAVPPVYDLQPREGVYEDFNQWEPEEKKLLSILRKGVEKLNLDEDARIKYVSSATEQEIYKGALNAPDAKEHVFCFLRSIQHLPPDQTAKDFIDLDNDGKQDKESHERLLNLKERLLKELPGNVHEYTNCNWTGNGITIDHLDKLCEDVYAELSGIITQEISTLKQVEPLEQEIASHRAFAEERSRNFIGREEIIKKILAYVQDESKAPLAIFGQGGSGKSALMAHVSKRIAEENQTAIVISRFIGATSASTNIFSLLESLCRQMARAYGQAEENIPTEFKELVEYFKNKLATSSKEKPLILLLDALDQLTDAENAKQLMWLPYDLPENVKIIVSALEPSLCFDQLKRRYSEDQIVKVGLMEPNEGNHLLALWLSESMRTLQENQRIHLLERYKGCSLPLYIKLAFEEAKTWKSYDVEKAEISGQDIPTVIQEFLGNLSAESKHGAVILRHAVGYLAAAKNGLTEEEMLDLLSLDEEVKKAFWKRSPNSPKTDRLPVVVWSRLYLDLKPYLTERQADQTVVMNYFHREFGEVIRSCFLDDLQMKQMHCQIATYFKSQPYEYQSQDGKLPNYRKVSEIAYQMMHGEMWADLQEAITDFDYPMTKCKSEMLDELIDDYQKANELPVPDKHAMKIWAVFFWERAHILRRGNKEWPVYKILLQVAIEHADDSLLTIGAEKFLTEEKCDWVWLRRERRMTHAEINPCIMVFEGHTSSVHGALELADGRILSWSADATLRIWEHNGKLVTILKGHANDVKGAIILRDGKLLSWSLDGTIRIWKIDGNLIYILEGHKSWVKGAIELSDGCILSWSNDNTLRVWDIDGKPLTVLEGHSESINGAIQLNNGTIVSWSWDGTFRFWATTGKLLSVIEGYEKLNGAIQLKNENIISWSAYNKLILLDKNGCEITRYHGHQGWVKGAIQLYDGRILSWSSDKKMIIWGGKRKKDVIMEGHTASIEGVQQLHDMRILSWAGFNDRSIRLWGADGSYSAILEGHSDPINGVIELKNGQILSWSSDKTIRLWDQYGLSMGIFEGDDICVNGAIQLSNEEVLSFGGDSNLRLWNIDVRSQKLLDGHTDWVKGAIQLTDDRVLSWSSDKTLIIWNAAGTIDAVMRGHTNEVIEAKQLPDGRIISWAFDATLRLWDINGNPIAVHDRALIDDETRFDNILELLQLPDGRIVWRSEKGKLRLWDINNGETILFKCNSHVEGVLIINNDELISWSDDNDIRLWKTDGTLLKVFKGHSKRILEVAKLPNSQLLSWSLDDTMRLWHKDGRCIEILHFLDVAEKHPEWWDLFYPDSSLIPAPNVLPVLKNSVALVLDKSRSVYWCAESEIKAMVLQPNGTLVATQWNGQVCFLKLYSCRKKIGLDELNEIYKQRTI